MLREAEGWLRFFMAMFCFWSAVGGHQPHPDVVLWTLGVALMRHPWNAQKTETEGRK